MNMLEAVTSQLTLKTAGSIGAQERSVDVKTNNSIGHKFEVGQSKEASSKTTATPKELADANTLRQLQSMIVKQVLDDVLSSSIAKEFDNETQADFIVSTFTDAVADELSKQNFLNLSELV